MKKLFLIGVFLLSFVLLTCNNEVKSFVIGDLAPNNQTKLLSYELNKNGKTILSRYPATEGFFLQTSKPNSFAHYLQNLPLKAYGEKVRYFNGRTKDNTNVYSSVVDLPISNRDLEQCADAVMRLKAEYHYHKKEYKQIQFNFLSDGKPRYFTKYAKGDISYQKFRKYMDYVMAFANTASLKDELEPVVNFKDLQIGDVIIQKGTPYGHAVIVVNLAKNNNGQLQFMLAQSYMPAQQTQILNNPKKKGENPWYDAKVGKIQTPEWTFNSSDLYRFP